MVQLQWHFVGNIDEWVGDIIIKKFTKIGINIVSLIIIMRKMKDEKSNAVSAYLLLVINHDSSPEKLDRKPCCVHGRYMLA